MLAVSREILPYLKHCWNPFKDRYLKHCWNLSVLEKGQLPGSLLILIKILTLSTAEILIKILPYLKHCWNLSLLEKGQLPGGLLILLPLLPVPLVVDPGKGLVEALRLQAGTGGSAKAGRVHWPEAAEARPVWNRFSHGWLSTVGRWRANLVIVLLRATGQTGCGSGQTGWGSGYSNRRASWTGFFRRGTHWRERSGGVRVWHL